MYTIGDFVYVADCYLSLFIIIEYYHPGGAEIEYFFISQFEGVVGGVVFAPAPGKFVALAIIIGVLLYSS